MPPANSRPGQQRGNKQVVSFSFCCCNKAAVGIGSAALRCCQGSRLFFSLSLSAPLFSACEWASSCCWLQVRKMAAAAPDITSVFKAGKRAEQRAFFLWGLGGWGGVEKTKTSTDAASPADFHLCLVGQNCVISEPQLLSKLGKQVFLSGVRYIAALHRTRIQREENSVLMS